MFLSLSLCCLFGHAPADADAEAKAVEFVERAGGKIRRSGGDAGSRVVEVRLSDHKGLTDKDLTALAGFTAVRELFLDKTGITDEGLAVLEGLTELEVL